MNNYLAQLISVMHLAARRVPKSKIPKGTFDPGTIMKKMVSAEVQN